MARVRHPPGALGRLRQRLQDARTRLHGERHLGVQDAVRQGPGLRGLPGAALLLERRDAAVQPRAAHGRRRLPGPPGPGGHRGLPPRDRRAGPRLDDDAVDRCRPTSRMAVGPDIDYVVVESEFTGRTERYVLAEARLAALRARAGRGRCRARRRAAQGLRPRRAPLHAAVLVLRGPRQARTVVLPADYVTTEDGTGIVHIAAAFGEDDKRAHRRRRHQPGRAGRRRRPLHLPGHRLRGPARLRRQPRDHRAPQGGHPRRGRPRRRHRWHRAAAARDLRPLLPALLALPSAADLHGGLVVVRRGDGVQGPDGRAQRADHLGARARQARPVRQVARERPRLVDLAQPVLGQPDPGVEVGQPRATRGSTSTARSRSSSATSASR